IASGMVCVTPRKFPAKMMVPPNSPRARAQAVMAPASSAGNARGTVREHPHTARAVYHRRLLHAAVHATETYGGLANVEVRGDEELGQHDRRGGEAELYAQICKCSPSSPILPSASSNAMPVALGGRTAGISTRVSFIRLPGKSARPEHRPLECRRRV